MASSVTVHIVNILVNTVNLGFASGNSIFLMLTKCIVTLEAMQYLYTIKWNQNINQRLERVWHLNGFIESISYDVASMTLWQRHEHNLKKIAFHNVTH